PLNWYLTLSTVSCFCSSTCCHVPTRHGSLPGSGEAAGDSGAEGNDDGAPERLPDPLGDVGGRFANAATPRTTTSVAAAAAPMTTFPRRAPRPDPAVGAGCSGAADSSGGHDSASVGAAVTARTLPSATASSGWSTLVGASAKARCSAVVTAGMRLIPPVRK